jgi:hypothetical protein
MKTFEFREQKNNWKVTDTNSVYISDLSPIEVYKKEVNDYHNLLLDDLLRRKNYLSLGEVQLWLNDENYGEEATKIIEWFKSTYQTIAEHLETITEYKNPQTFLQNLPVLN